MRRLLAAPVPKQRELLAKVIDKIEVWSTQSGGPQTRWNLERVKVHLRPDMWLTSDEVVNLFSMWT